MNARTRQVVRLLADLRHARRCSALRAAKAQEALRLAEEEAAEIEVEEDRDSRTPSPEEPQALMH
jgi:hypothetical protein